MAYGGAELWDLTFLDWADVKSVQHLNAGEEFEAIAIAHHPLGGEYYMTAEDYNNSGQSAIPYRPWGANIDDLEDYPVDTTSQEQQPEQVSEPEPQLAVEPSPAQAPEPTPPAPQITYSDLPTPLNFVTNKAPTNVYDLDMDTFAKITAVKELAEGTPFKAVSKAEVVEGSETTTYYVDAQSQSVNNDDLTPASDDSVDQAQTTVTEPPAPDDNANQEQTTVIDQLVSENERSAPTETTEPDLNKIFNYKDFPDGRKLFLAVGKTNIDDLNPVNPKSQETLVDNDPMWIQGAFTDPKTGINYYRSDKSVANGDWYAIPINAVTHDNDVDHLSSSAIDMSKKQKMLNRVGSFAGTPVGLIRDIYFKTKRG